MNPFSYICIVIKDNNMIEDFDFNNSYQGIQMLKKLDDYTFYEVKYPNLRNEIEQKIKLFSEQEDVESTKEFITTCVKYEDGYRHFGIHEITACLYGDKKEDIVRVRMKKSINQDKENNSDYWGFFDISRGEYSLIYRNLYCLTVCFPASMGVYEKIREGLFIKLDIIEEL